MGVSRTACGAHKRFSCTVKCMVSLWSAGVSMWIHSSCTSMLPVHTFGCATPILILWMFCVIRCLTLCGNLTAQPPFPEDVWVGEALLFGVCLLLGVFASVHAICQAV